jgi:UDP-glucose 4-epimerase
MKRVLVTGGAGFIGSHIVDALIQTGEYEVDVVDNLYSGFRENVHPKANFFEMDIVDPEIVEWIARQKYHLIFHQAAQMDVRKSVQDPTFDAKVNIIGSIHILEGARRGGTQKIIFASSGGTCYGEQQEFPATEDHPLQPLSPYGVAKVSVEKYLYVYAHAYGLNYVSLRYANVYGPRQNPHGEAGVVAIFIKKMLQNDNPIINGDGFQTRDFIYVEDVVKANLLAIDYPENDVFNIGTGIETSVNEIFHLLNQQFGNQFEEIHGPPKPGEQRRSVLNCTKAKEKLKWTPSVRLSEGLKHTVQWFKETYALS